jgi:type I restriction enzyme S subunit
VRIGDICTVTSSKRIFKSEYVENGIPFYRTKELKELANGRDIKTELFISNKRFIEIKVLILT